MNKLTKPTKNENYIFHPSQLSARDRANHVVEALLQYNEGIIKNNPEGANLKFENLRASAFVFMRGTADLMYRDLYGTNADKSMVLCMGDVHLENYGVMESDDHFLIWGLNDFDEANFAPFTWDIKRGATSVILAALDENRKAPFSKKKAKQMARAFAEAYLETIIKGIENKNYQFVFKQENSPKEISKLLNKSSKIKEDKYLRKNYLDKDYPSPRFKNTNEIERIIVTDNKLQHRIQKSLDGYLKSLDFQNKKVPKKIKIWDLATKTGSGKGSIGLWRYYALVELLHKKDSQNIILEIKQERESVLAPYVGGGLLTFQSPGSRVAYAENIQLPNANPFYGYTEIGRISYLIRKRSPHKRSIKLEKLKKFKAFNNYVKACGKALALAHLQSDNALMEVYPDFAKSILHSVNPETFSTDISGFASKMAAQVRRDWKYFKRAYREGKFDFIA